MEQRIIGVTPRIVHVEGQDKVFINQTYIDAINNLGFIPLMLPTNNDSLDKALDLCDGFLITGGSDISPSYFNQKNQGSKGCKKNVDEVDRLVIQYGIKTKKPMLGICRGHQAINIFLGGDLIQDIGKSHTKVTHTVKTYKNRLLNFDEEITVNSFHHQVLGKLAPGLITVAESVEGYNEAFIHESLPIISCQWHPERLDTKESEEIFNKFKSLFK